MATTKVSALAETTSPQANDELLINQSGVSKKVKVTNLGIGTPTDNSVTTAKIADDAVTVAKLNLISTSSVPSLEAKGDGNTQDGYIQLNCRANTHGIKLKSPPHSAGANYTLTFPNNDGDADQKLTTNGSGVLTWTDDSTTVADGSISTAKIADDAVTAAKLANSINAEITANTAKTTNATHTGDVTGATALTIGNDKVVTAMILNDNVTADKLANSINTDIATGVTANTTANAALPKAGGTMTGNVTFGDNNQIRMGGSNDLAIYHNGTNSVINEEGTGNLQILGNGAAIEFGNNNLSERYATFTHDGAVDLYHNNVKKIETTANGVTVTGGAVGTMTTDNDGSFAMSASNNFKCTPSGNFTLTFTAIVAQSGNILLVNSGGHTVAAHANTKVDANLLATVSAAGTYLLSYFSDGTNVYMTNSAIYT